MGGSQDARTSESIIAGASVYVAARLTNVIGAE